MKKNNWRKLPRITFIIVVIIATAGLLFLNFKAYKSARKPPEINIINASIPKNIKANVKANLKVATKLADKEFTKIKAAYTVKQEPKHTAHINPIPTFEQVEATLTETIETHPENLYAVDKSRSKSAAKENGKRIAANTVYAPQLDIADYYFTSSPHNTVFARGFVPFSQDANNVLYLDARAILKQKGIAREGNLGFGYRHLNSANSKMFGAYMFYDRKRTSDNSIFSQITFGSEYWLDRYFLGANFYLPVGNRTVTNTNVSYSASLQTVTPSVFNVLVTKTNNNSTDVAMIGGDVTVAYQPTDSFTGYGGFYYFHSSASNYKLPIICGPFARIRYSIFTKPKQRLGYINELSLESQIQYDKVRKTVWYAGLRLTFAFGGSRLNRMQQHMVDPAMRDIDVVSLNNTSSSSSTSLATNPNGGSLIVKQTDSTSFNAAVGDNSIDVIAVQGVVTNANSLGTTLATNQVVTGGNVAITVDNGTQIQAQVSSGGELQSVSGATNMLKLGKNNVIRDLILTMISPSNANGSNIAIAGDSAINDLGSATIQNVISNGAISIPRTGAAQSATVNISGSTFNIGTTWAPTNIPAVGQFDISTNAILNLTVDNCSFISNSTKEIVGLRIGAASGSNVTVTNITNSTINGTDAGLVLASQGGTLHITGDVANNTIDGGAASLHNEIGLIVFTFGSTSGSVTMDGLIRNNTITGSDTGINVINFGGSAISTINLHGMVNNAVTGSQTNGIYIKPNALVNDTFTINNFYGNTVHGVSPNADIQVSAPNTTIQVGQGSTGLSAANNNAVVGITGSPTILPSP